MKPNDLKEAARIVEFLEEEIQHVSFHIKKGEHINIIGDKILFSVVGYNASESEIQTYVDWENTRFYLRSLISKLHKNFHNWKVEILDKEIVIVPKNH